MDEKRIIISNPEPGLTQSIEARYARYMDTADKIFDKKPETSPVPTVAETASVKEILYNGVPTNPHTGLEALSHGGTSAEVKPVSAQEDNKKKEDLKKPNILQALWKALVEAFTKGKGLREQGVKDALSLSEAFSEVVASQPNEHTLMLSYLNWQKLATENKESPHVVSIAEVGRQEVTKRIIAKGIDLKTFEDKAKQYYVDNEKEISIAGLRASIEKGTDIVQADGIKARIQSLEKHVDETLKRDAPILPGEIFSPTTELEKIMNIREQKEGEATIERPNKTHAEREIALAAYKEKLAYQKVGLADLRESLLTKLSTLPEMTQDDADREIMAYANTFGFDNAQLGVIAEITDDFLTRREKVQKLKSDFTDKESQTLDVNGLFKSVMGDKDEVPQGIKVFFGPISVGFVIEDQSAFAKVVGDEKVIENDRAGRSLANVHNPEFKNMVIVVRSDEQKVKDHETQHVIDTLMLPLVDKAAGEKPSSLKDRLAGISEIDPKTLNDKQNLVIDKYLARIRDLRLEEMHTEIFAFSQQGLTETEIQEVLLGNYLIDRKNELDNFLKANDNTHEAKLRERFTLMFGDEYKDRKGNYRNLTETAIKKFHLLHAKGYSTEQIIGILGAIPLRDWEKTVDRVAAEEKLDTQVDVAKHGFDRLHAARLGNAGKAAFKEDEESILNKNRKFSVVGLATDPTIDIADEVIDKIDLTKYIDPSVKRLVTEIVNLPGSARYSTLENIRSRIDALVPPAGPPLPVDVEAERQKALRIISSIEKGYREEAQKKQTEYAQKRKDELIDLDDPHSVATKYQYAVDLLRLYGSEIFEKPVDTLNDADKDKLLETSEIGVNRREQTYEKGNLVTWVEELQKIVWMVEHNINKDKNPLQASNEKKKIINEFANEHFDQYKTKEDFWKMQRLLNKLLSDDQSETNNAWANGMSLTNGDIKSVDAKLLGIDVKALFGEVVTQKRKKVTKKRSMQDAYEPPPSFQDVVEQVIGHQAPPEYRTGGPFEVIDRKGNPNFQNLERYIRRLILIQHQANPKDQVDFFNHVRFPGLVQLTLGDLTDPKLGQFRITNNLEFSKGNLDNPAEGFVIDTGARNEPRSRGDDPDVKAFLDKMRSFAYNFWQIHNYFVIYTDNQSKGSAELGKMIGQIHHKNDYIDSLQIYFKMVETNIDSKEFTKKLRDEEKGEAGNAMRMALFLYKYIDELADNRRKTDKKGNPTETMRQYFERNIFYRTLTNNLKDEDLGGLDDFFFTVAGEAIAGNPNSDSRNEYKKLVIEQLQSRIIKDVTPEDEQRLINARIEEVANTQLYGIRIDTNTALVDVLAHQYKKRPTDFNISPTATDDEINRKAAQDARQRMHDAMMQKDPSGKTVLETLVQVDKLYAEGSEADKRKKLEADYEKFWVRDPNNTDLEKYGGLEKYAFNFLKLINEKYGQADLNIFDAQGKSEILIRTVRAAIRNSVGTIYNLNDIDRTLAEEVIFSFSKPILNGFAAADKNAVAFDGASKFINEYDYLQKTMSGRGGIANPLGMRNIMHGVIPFMDFIKVNVTDDDGKIKRETLSEWLQGGLAFQDRDKGGMDLKAPLKTWAAGGIANNAGQNWGAVHVGNAAELFEDREANIMSLDSIIKQDARGNYIVDYQAGQKLLKDRWKKIRYSLGGTGANEFPDNDPDQKLRIRKKTIKDGKTVFEFDWEPRANYVFGKPVRDMWEVAKKRRLKKDKHFLTDQGEVASEGAKQEYKKEIADMIAIRLKHSNFRERAFASDIQKFKFFYLDFAKSSYDIDENGKEISNVPFLSDDDWKDVLKAAGTSELKLDLNELRIQVAYGLGSGIGKMFKEFFKKIGGEVAK